MKPNELWTGALCLLEKRTTAFSFEAWLQPLRVEESAAGLKLCCPNAFHQGRVRDRFLTPRHLQDYLRIFGSF